MSLCTLFEAKPSIYMTMMETNTLIAATMLPTWVIAIPRWVPTAECNARDLQPSMHLCVILSAVALRFRSMHRSHTYNAQLYNVYGSFPSDLQLCMRVEAHFSV